MQINDLEKIVKHITESLSEILKERDEKIVQLQKQIDILSENKSQGGDSFIQKGLTCECGGNFSHGYKKEHLRTQRHMNYFKIKELSEQVEKSKK